MWCVLLRQLKCELKLRFATCDWELMEFFRPELVFCFSIIPRRSPFGARKPSDYLSRG